MTLHVLGPLDVRVAGERRSFHAVKGRELLALLVDARLAGRHELPQLELQGALYPSGDDGAAASALQQLVYRVRRAIAPGIVLRTATGYTLGDAAVDAETFLGGGATTLWRGTYLEDVAPPPDAGVSARLYRALCAAARAALEGDPHEAVRLAGILLRHEPYALEHVRLVVRSLLACGDREALERTYDGLRARLSDVGETLPAAWTAFVDGGAEDPTR